MKKLLNFFCLKDFLRAGLFFISFFAGFCVSAQMPLSVNAYESSPPYCPGNDGEATVEILGGIAPYNVTTSLGGSYTLGANFPLTIYATTGWIDITVVDFVGTVANSSVYISDSYVQPDYYFDVIDATCAGYGTICVLGNGLYITIPNGQTSNCIDNLMPGDWTLIVHYGQSNPGCDVEEVVNIGGVNPIIPPTISANGINLTCNYTYSTYQWINCSTNLPIIGANQPTFIPTLNGDYAVVVSEGSCIDTSNCYTISTVNLIEMDFLTQIKGYPNPTSDIFTIDLGKEFEGVEVKIFSLVGQLILSEKYAHSQLLQIKLPEMKGVYFANISLLNGESTTLKMIKE